jgi:hypothetical protein
MGVLFGFASRPVQSRYIFPHIMAIPGKLRFCAEGLLRYNFHARFFSPFCHLNSNMLPDLQLNDTLRMRKPHPCGSYEWNVVRLGADIGLECKGCGRRVMLTRRELARRIKVILPEKSHVQSSD